MSKFESKVETKFASDIVPYKHTHTHLETAHVQGAMNMSTYPM